MLGCGHDNECNKYSVMVSWGDILAPDRRFCVHITHTLAGDLCQAVAAQCLNLQPEFQHSKLQISG